MSVQAILQIENVYHHLPEEIKSKISIEISQACTGKLLKKIEPSVFVSPKIKVYDIEQWPSLNKTYPSEDEFNKHIKKFTERYNIKRIIFLGEDNNVCMGKGMIRTIGKFRLIY